MVAARLFALLAASGYVLWNLAQSLDGRSVVASAAGVAAAMATALYFFGRYRKKLSKANLLIWALPWVCLALVFFLTASALARPTVRKQNACESGIRPRGGRRSPRPQ